MSTSAYDLAREQMLRRQLRNRGIHDPRVLSAMARVPRERFVDDSLRDQAYDDRALPIDCGQTISQPYIVGIMSQALSLCGQERVLEIGTGSGYQTAILAELASEVVTIERHPELSAKAQAVLAELGYRNITFVIGDGTQGHPDRAPYDRILVAAAARRCPPALLAQLADGGILVIPLGGPDDQLLQAIVKVADTVKLVDLCRCRFVPLVGSDALEGPKA